MKRFFSVLLLCGILASMIVLPVSAEMKLADNTPEEIALMQRAVVETAAAYLAKGDRVQYGRNAMTVQNNRTTGVAHVSTGDAPETAGLDHILYTNCVDFTFSVYWNTFHHGPADINARNVLVRHLNSYKNAADPDVVLKYGGEGGMTDQRAFWEQMQQVLQPGDLVNTVDWDIERGHSMLYVGDYKGDGKHYVIHSSGGDSGLMGDNHAKTVKLTTWDIFLGTGTFGLRNPKVTQCTILRPINVIDFDELTESAKARLEHPLMVVDRSAQYYRYAPVQTGEEIAVSLTVVNQSREHYTDLEIVDPAPVGAQVIPETISDGGELTPEGGVRWKLDVAAGTYRRRSYSIRVTAGLGEDVTLAAGTVGGLPTRDFAWQVSGKPLDTNLMTILGTTGKSEGLTESTVTADVEFVNKFYRQALGIDLALPSTLQEISDHLLTVIDAPDAPSTNDKILTPRAFEELSPEYKVFSDMIIDDHLTGQMVYLGTHPDTQKPENRVMTYFQEAYQPGDIFLVWSEAANKAEIQSYRVITYVYLGMGRVAAPSTGGFQVVDFGTSIERLGQANLVIALRPTLNRADLASDVTPIRTYLTAEPEVPETPIAPEVPAEPETPETPAAPEVPAEPETPEAPTTPETPVAPEAPTEPEAPAEPEAPEQAKGVPVGLIVGIVAAAVIAVIAAAVLKKKKK